MDGSTGNIRDLELYGAGARAVLDRISMAMPSYPVTGVQERRIDSCECYEFEHYLDN